MICNSIFVAIENDHVNEFKNIESYKLIYKDLNKSYFLSYSKWKPFINILKITDKVNLTSLPAEQVSIVTSMVPKFGKEVSELIARILLKVPSCNSIEDIIQILISDQHFVERIIDDIKQDTSVSENINLYIKELEQLKISYNEEIASIMHKANEKIKEIENRLSIEQNIIIKDKDKEITRLLETINIKDKEIYNLENKIKTYKLQMKTLLDMCNDLNISLSSTIKERDKLLNIINKRRV